MLSFFLPHYHIRIFSVDSVWRNFFPVSKPLVTALLIQMAVNCRTTHFNSSRYTWLLLLCFNIIESFLPFFPYISVTSFLFCIYVNYVNYIHVPLDNASPRDIKSDDVVNVTLWAVTTTSQDHGVSQNFAVVSHCVYYKRVNNISMSYEERSFNSVNPENLWDKLLLFLSQSFKVFSLDGNAFLEIQSWNAET